MKTHHRGVWTRDDQLAEPYRYLPVDVPPGCRALSVSVEYDRSAGALDLGCLGPGGFRGWSGGARDRFAITPRAATPGYLPGELEPGTWQVVLGLHRIGPAGLPWLVTATAGRIDAGELAASGIGGQEAPEAAGLGPRPSAGARPPARDLPHPAGLRWLAGDPHTHSVHSDGVLTVGALAALAAGRGLDYVAVTDHNTVSHHAELAAASARCGVTLVPGQEVTTSLGHAGVLGDVGWIDFRRPADEWLAESTRRGGLMSVNHPLAADCAWRHPLAACPPLAEVWHWTWLDRRWGGPLAWWTAHGSDVVPVGGSDWHRPGADAPPGEPTTWVACADRSAEAVLDGLRAGRTAVSASRDGPVVLRVDGEVVVVGGSGLVLHESGGGRSAVRGDRERRPGRPGPYLLTDHDGGVVALCG